jgi:NOP5NT (NUC127) domain
MSSQYEVHQNMVGVGLVGGGMYQKPGRTRAGKVWFLGSSHSSSHSSKSFAVTLIAQLEEAHIDTGTRCVFTNALSFGGIRAPTMLVLYETAIGFALFKLTDSAKLTDPNLHKEFDTPEKANGLCVKSLRCQRMFIALHMMLHSIQTEIEIPTSIHDDCDCC